MKDADGNLPHHLAYASLSMQTRQVALVRASHECRSPNPDIAALVAPETQAGSCVVCNRTAGDDGKPCMRCARCKSVFYCSQVRDTVRRLRPRCSPLRIVEVPSRRLEVTQGELQVSTEAKDECVQAMEIMKVFTACPPAAPTL